MFMPRQGALLVCALTLFSQRAIAEESGAAGADDALLTVMEAELSRAMDELAQSETPPYFLAVEVTEIEAVNIAAEEGGLQGYSPQQRRHVDVDLRLGAPDFDSTHPLRGGGGQDNGRYGKRLPLGEDPQLLRRGIWFEVNRRLSAARERWAKVESDKQVLVQEEPAPDLAPTDPQRDLLAISDLQADLPYWEETLRQASAELAASDIVHDGSVRFSGLAQNQWFASSEGARLRHGHSRFALRVLVDTVAEDGAALRLARSWNARDPQGLPDREQLVAEVRDFEDLLARLRMAPEQEPYTGPAILSDRAAAVFFHEILGHRLEGHRLKLVDDAQTLRDMIGQAIMPAFLSIHDDPTQQRYGDFDLNGHYLYDNQGVPAQRVPLVVDGVLQGFLQSRSPVGEGERSNGHGRRQVGFDAVSRQGNLLVSASQSVSDEQLRQELRQLARQEGLEYGLLVDDIQGGVTFTGRRIPNAFKVNVLVAWRVYVDGRPDELVRGMDLIGTPLVTLSRIVRAGEIRHVFNGTCGAESGGVPVSAVSPALLVSQVETQRQSKGQNMPPLLAPPGSATAQGKEVRP